MYIKCKKIAIFILNCQIWSNFNTSEIILGSNWGREQDILGRGNFPHGTTTAFC